MVLLKKLFGKKVFCKKKIVKKKAFSEIFCNDFHVGKSKDSLEYCFS